MSLLRPTTAPLEATEPVESTAPTDEGDGQDEGQGRAADSKPSRTRRKRVPVGGETRGRKLVLSDDVHDRLWLYARQRKQPVSAVANDLLDRALPRFKVERLG